MSFSQIFIKVPINLLKYENLKYHENPQFLEHYEKFICRAVIIGIAFIRFSKRTHVKTHKTQKKHRWLLYKGNMHTAKAKAFLNSLYRIFYTIQIMFELQTNRCNVYTIICTRCVNRTFCCVILYFFFSCSSKNCREIDDSIVVKFAIYYYKIFVTADRNTSYEKT